MMSSLRFFAVALGASLFVISPTAFAQSESATPDPLQVYPTDTPIRIDGELDEPIWATAARLDVDFEWFPGDGVTPPVATECRITYDDSRLYIAFRAHDPDPASIRAHLMDRDDIQPFVQDDHIGLLLDPFNDERRAFQFRVNPLGVQADAIFSELEGFEDFSWDIIWESAGQIYDWGYAVEIAIPFNQLRFEASTEPQTWGFQASRSYPRAVRHRANSNFQDRNRSCILCQINKIEGFAGITPGRNIELAPTVASIRSDTRDLADGASFEKGEFDFEPGLTARWGITSNLVLNATVNPDFSQVEADAAQLDVNNRFALFFEEKRPFFLEGADFFLTPLQAVFTRTVADPIVGAKVTGKAGRNALGVFATRDRVNSLVLPSNQSSIPFTVEDEVDGQVVRYRRDVGEGSTVGVLYTGRHSTGYANHVGGVDGFVRLSRTNTLQFQYLQSQTEYPEAVAGRTGDDAQPFSGHAAQLTYQHRSNAWAVNAGLQDISNDFRADYGFIQRVDLRLGNVAVRRIFRGEAGDWFSQILTGFNASQARDRDGTLTDQTLAFSTLYQGPAQSTLVLDLSTNKELFGDRTYQLDQLQLFGNVQPNGSLSLGLTGQAGDQIDFTNQQAASELVVSPSVGIKIGRGFNISARNTLQRLQTGGNHLFTANILQGTTRYNFNVRTFVRLILQYQTVRRTLANYHPDLQGFLDADSKRLFSQLLFSYKINPQTVLFLGYSDTYLGFPSVDLRQTGRTFFFKLGYAWVV